MESKISLDGVYAISEDVVAREIEGEILIVPLVAGVGDIEDELFTLNGTGKVIWEWIDGRRKLQDVVKELSAGFEVSGEELKEDVTGFMEELLKRGIIVEVSAAQA